MNRSISNQNYLNNEFKLPISEDFNIEISTNM